MSDDNIIEFKPGIEITPRPIKALKRMCQHTHVLVDEQTRSLICKKCNTTINVFDFIMQLATRRERFFQSLEYFREEKEKLTKEVEELERKERNVKARIKRAQKKIW